MWRLILFTLIPGLALAAPKNLEVWFLSNAKKAQVLELLERNEYGRGVLTASLQCQQMGDYCFDPQVGLYKKDDLSLGAVDAKDAFKEDTPTIPSGKSLDRDLINCDKGNYFDVFCGKARSEVRTRMKLEVWVDTSSSMREFDVSDKEGGCFRKSLLTRLDETCPFNQKVNVMTFDTSIKEAGTLGSLCNNQGLNDYKRLMDWIERSEATTLIVITDVYELHKEFADFIESKNGKVVGDKDAMTAAELLSRVDALAKYCK